MADFLDKIHDLAHHAVDAVTGAISAPSAPEKPAATEAPASDWVSRAQATAQRDRNASIDKQIADAGG